MRIAIASDWFPPRRGGIEMQLAQLCERLASRGHTVEVLTSMPGAAGTAAFRVRSLAHLAVPRLHLALSPRVLAATREELSRGYDVVHAHVSVLSPLAYAAAAAAQSLSLPTVLTFHSILRHKQVVLRAVDAVLGLASTPIVWTGVSELVAGQLREALPGVRVSVLPNGVEISFWGHPRASDAPRQPRDVVRLVSTMRLHRKKRPMALVAAFAGAAARAHVPATLTIAGDGPERAALVRDIRARGLDAGSVTVHLAGWQPAAALRSLYMESDAFVMPSERESFGIAALEAAATGLPVIAMRAGGAREFVGNGAGGVLCEDDADLMRVLANVLQSPPDRTLPVRDLARYDWPVVLDAHEAAYQRAIERSTAVRLRA